MKINWKVRFRNRAWLTSFCAAVCGFVYTMLSLLDLAPSVTQDTVMQVGNALLFVLTVLGVVIDPTTEGVGDSERALSYKQPG